MKIYGVYHDCFDEGGYTGFFKTKRKARFAAKKVVAEQQERATEMRNTFNDPMYRDFEESEKNMWIGGYGGFVLIVVEEITVQ